MKIPDQNAYSANFFQQVRPSLPANVKATGTAKLCLLGFTDYNSTQNSAFAHSHEPSERLVISPALGTVWLTAQQAKPFRIGDAGQRDELPIAQQLRMQVRRSLASTGFISGHPNAYSARGEGLRTANELNADRANFQQIGHWLNRCQTQHGTYCSVPQHGQHSPSSLISCRTLIVEEKSGHPRYVALSYVWGKKSNKETSQSLRHLWPRLPSAIEDAIRVTRRLGFQYLWVDYLCIPQHPLEIESAVSNMGSIYNNADLVVFASCGDGADGGLPGVFKTRRNRQPSVIIGPHRLISSMMSPVERVRRSTRKPRGWTYQEERSARRRLYFTEDQVYFECGRSTCAEVDSNTQEWPNRGRNIDHETTASLIESLHFDTSGAVREHWSHVREVSQMRLTYPEDVLNAILGVLRLPLPNYHFSPCHLQGIPLNKDDGGFPSPSYFASQLCWTLDRPGLRRKGFPSWSWTGWIGQPVSPPTNYYTSLLAMADDSLIGVTVQSEASGEHRKLRELYQQNHLDASYNKPGTHILQMTTMGVAF